MKEALGRDAQGRCGGKATDECVRSGGDPLAQVGRKRVTTSEDPEGLLPLLTDEARQTERIQALHIRGGLRLAVDEADELDVHARLVLETEDCGVGMGQHQNDAILLDTLLGDQPLDHLQHVVRCVHDLFVFDFLHTIAPLCTSCQ